MAPVGARALQDLLRQLARGHEDERPQGGSGAALREALQDRQHEGGRFAGAGLCGPNQVAPGEGERDGLQLNGGGLLVAFLGYRTQQLGREPEGCKWHF